MKWKVRNIKDVDPNEQMLIYAHMRNYDKLSPTEQHLATQYINDIAGEQSKALHEALTTDRTLLELSMRYYIEQSTLCRMVHTFYRRAAVNNIFISSA